MRLSIKDFSPREKIFLKTASPFQEEKSPCTAINYAAVNNPVSHRGIIESTGQYHSAKNDRYYHRDCLGTR